MFIFRYLAVAASLTGGNALAAFIKMIQVRNYLAVDFQLSNGTVKMHVIGSNYLGG